MEKTQHIINLGQTYPQEAELSAYRIREARRNYPEIPKDVLMFDIGVAVFVNGKIQYHGGATIGRRDILSRDQCKQIALSVLAQDFDPRGNVALTERKE